MEKVMKDEYLCYSLHIMAMKKNNRNTKSDGICSRADDNTVSIPPELKGFEKHTTARNYKWLQNADAIGIDGRDWQSDPSRIIYYNGSYHMWIIDTTRKWLGESSGLYSDNMRELIETPEHIADGLSRILYLASHDGHIWKARHHLPLGPAGSCYDLDLEQANVVFHDNTIVFLVSVGFDYFLSNASNPPECVT